MCSANRKHKEKTKENSVVLPSEFRPPRRVTNFSAEMGIGLSPVATAVAVGGRGETSPLSHEYWEVMAAAHV